MRTLALLLALAVPALGSDWIEIKSPNFVVRTNAGDRRGRDIALRFEQMRKVFGTLLPRKLKVTAPLMIVAFKDDKGLKEVSPLWKGKPVDLAGFYLKGEDTSYIALNAGAENAWQTVFHEYAHFLLNTNFPPTPPWWDEGFAGYYSTIQVDKKDFVIGTPPEGYGQLLAEGMMPLERLFSVTQETSDYNVGNARTIFYAQSWLFVDYIFQKKLLDETTRYFSLIRNQNLPPKEAVQLAYGKTFKELDTDLRNFLAANKTNAYRFPIPLGLESIAYEMERLSDLTVQATIADLHLHSKDHQERAEAEFKQIIAKEPRYADAYSGLGYVLMRRGEYDAATEKFQQAAEIGSKDPHVYYFAAFNLYKKDPNSKEYLVEMGKYLDRALQLDDNYGEAYNLKSIVVARAANTAEAIRLLRKAIELEPRRDDYKMNLAYNLMVARQFDEAQALLEKLAQSTDEAVAANAQRQIEVAKQWKASPLTQMAANTDRSKYTSEQWSRQPGDREDSEADNLQSSRDDREPDQRPIKFAKGTLLSSECSESGDTLIRAKVGTRILKLHSPDHKKILMVGANKFDCKWKNRLVSINYRERSPLEGDLFSLEVK